ncbi:metallophosphoesterase family protein [bacterium]|jgi:diadenosine tetraphosphatase ApaH/serine/threonine PP2A family protein phosphatase|nr:metallophosphoesterase family protein [bacterium]
MTIGILSDVHGNLPALEAVLRDCEARKYDTLICLGDTVGYGASPNECCELIRQNCANCVLGNHDAALTGSTALQLFNAYARAAVEWSQGIIEETHLAWLRDLPYTHMLDGLLFVHATPKDPAAWNYIHNPDEAVPHFEVMSAGRTAFIGHSHIPALFNGPEKRRIINVGAIGQPRDRNPHACYGSFCTESGDFDWIRVPYDVQSAAKAIRDAGLPEFLASRLFIGM